MPIVTYLGKIPIPVHHRQWLPGERRQLSEKQARQLEAQYPGQFDWPRPKKAASRQRASKPEPTSQSQQAEDFTPAVEFVSTVKTPEAESGGEE